MDHSGLDIGKVTLRMYSGPVRVYAFPFSVNVTGGKLSTAEQSMVYCNKTTTIKSLDY